MSDLKSCPFCGPGNSVVEYYQDPYGYHIVGCGRCGSHSGTRPPSDPDGKAKVIASWNSRPMEDLLRTAQAAPSDRERLVKDAYFEGFCAGESSTIGEPEEYWDKSEARAALADTTNNDGG